MPRGGARGGVNAPPVSDHTWLECCAAAGQHRFDCPGDTERHKRSGGPFLPPRSVP